MTGLAIEDLQAAVTEDDFLGGALRIVQPRTGYRAGIDAVLLAAAAPLEPGRGGEVLDCGAGVGTVGLCVARRVPDARVVLLEREPRLAEIAALNIRRNGLGDRVSVIQAEVGAPAVDLDQRGLASGSFDHVLANPPFHVEGHGTPAADPVTAAARAMGPHDLGSWARFMARMTAPGGSATIIHTADTLARLSCALAGRFGALKVLPIHPREGAPAIRVMIQGIKGSRAPLTLLPGFVLHGPGEAFLPAAEAVLRGGGELRL